MKMMLALFSCSLFLQGSGLKMVKTVDGYKPKTDDYIKELEDCYTEEDERLARQRAEANTLGVLGDFFGAGCGFAFLQVQLEDDGQRATFQDNQNLGSALLPGGVADSFTMLAQLQRAKIQNNQSIIGGLCAFGQGVVGVADGFQSREHERQNLQGTDCARMSAYATLKKLDQLQQATEEGFQDIKNDLTKMENKMDANHLQTSKTLSHLAQQGRESQFKVQRLIQSEVAAGMNALSKDTALLAAKLDDVLQRVSESMDVTEVANYKVLFSRLAAAMAVVRGAREDILGAEQDHLRHNMALPSVRLDKANVIAARMAIQEWQETSAALAEKMRSEAQAGWRRARDAFADISAVLATGDLLFLHFKVQLRNTAAKEIASANSQLEDLLWGFALGQALDKTVADDPLLSVIFATIVDAGGIMEMYLSVFPNYEEVAEFSESLKAVAEYLQKVPDRLKQPDFLVSILEGPVLTKYPIEQECLRAAFKQGYTNTDMMVRWKSGEIALASHAIAGSVNHAFFKCADRPLTKSTKITEQTFAERTRHGCKEGIHHENVPNLNDYPAFKAQCDGLSLDFEINCDEDYWLPALEVDSTKLTCTSKTGSPVSARVNGGRERWNYEVRWTCRNPAAEKLSVEAMKSCHRKPDVVAKTFSEMKGKTLPYNPAKNKILQQDKAIGGMASFVTKFSERIGTVQRHGAMCNTIATGGLHILVGPHWFQVGSWRFRADGVHIWVDTPHQVAAIFRRDQTMHNGGRASLWHQAAHGWRVLKSVSMEIPENYQVQFGDRFIQIGHFRIAALDGHQPGDHLSVSYNAPGWGVKVIQIFRADGTIHNVQGPNNWHAWNRPIGEPIGVYMGFLFIQIGNWRLVDHHRQLYVVNVVTGRSNVQYTLDGRAIYNNMDASFVLGSPVCSTPKSSM